MSEVSKSQPCSGGTPSASSSGCDVTCCLSDACASLVGRSSKSIRNTNPRSAICPHLSRLNRGSALKILWSSWCDLKAPNCWPRPHPLSLFEMYWALCLSWWQRDPVGTAWSKQVAPQPGQAQGPLIHTTPPLVPTGPWDASISMDRIPRFGRQHSSGLDLAGGEELSRAFEPCLSKLKHIPSHLFSDSFWK